MLVRLALTNNVECDVGNHIFLSAHHAPAANDLPGSFCTKRIDRNWLGKELGHAEEETDAGADCAAAAADRGCDVPG